ncbi:MAG TPA: hypothetical protein VE135_12845 [Pyrinomonadaceae bacterium]|nr:hypothetical protein [Pyrinomonadaceae bacterium]
MVKRKAFIKSFLMISLAGLYVFSSAVHGQTPRVEQVAFSPPTLSLAADPVAITTCAGDTSAAIVRLDASGTSTRGNPARYSWRASAGKIQGDGPTVTWDLAGVSPGYYKAFLDVKSGSTNEECESFSSTTVFVNCLPPPPVCPNVSIVCPDQVAVDQPITFTAALAGGSGNVAANYSWSISGGRIVEGQGTTSIIVDTKGLAGQTIRAEFLVNGYPSECSASCVVQIPLPKQTCKRFDEFPSIQRNDEKARLDNFAVELQSDPTATGYVVVSPAANGRAGEVQKHSSRILDYLVNSRGIDARRIVPITGTARNELMVELWSCPQGAVLPSKVP